MGGTGAPLPFPGGTSVSRLRVYDWPAPDGAGLVGSGTPHLHTASSEGYVVLGGTGSVQTLSAEGFTETPLEAGVVVWFSPGVVHRLVNDGGLDLVVVMSNAGLPEAGDAVLTFPPAVLADPERYREAVTLPVQDEGTEDDDVVAAAARARRDLALEGYAALRARVEGDGGAGLAELHAAAARLVSSRVPQWQQIVRDGVEASTARTVEALAGLAAADPTHLAGAAISATGPRPGPRRYGMCGRLQTWEL
ncbi:cupin domain-containing protein [Actinotalea sp. BY-33]|uniref:Cupin domain-containing protein n=1 Tax=Actinotalea soli TaxID=2819234 RepID=A0A939LT92_9CELL|nr:cupin domain-containing protein [Actinotalea soli]MBO1752600.1 cupin domain-containing protein [Actinotalea soli]